MAKPYIAPSALGLTRPSWNWRPAEGLGQVHGIPSLRGRLVATDGCLAALALESGKVEIVHLDAFEKDKEEKQSTKGKRSERKARKPVGPTLEDFE